MTDLKQIDLSDLFTYTFFGAAVDIDVARKQRFGAALFDQHRQRIVVFADPFAFRCFRGVV